MDYKNWIIAALVLLVGFLALRSYNLQGEMTANEDLAATTTTATTTDTPTASTQGTAKAAAPAAKTAQTYTSLLKQQGSYQCDYDQVLQSGQNHNVIYLSGGKMRAEFRTVAGDKTTASLSVYDGRYLYSWKEGFADGTKTSITALSQLPAAIPSDLTSGKIYGTTYESVGWKCRAWIPDAKLLIPPSYVIFR